MKKNKQVMHQKRVLKAKQRREKGKERRQKEEVQKTMGLLKFLTGKFDLFNATIINYLNSDYDSGRWDPVYPDLHTDPNFNSPIMDEVIAKILMGLTPETVTPKHQVMVQWLRLPISIKRGMYSQIAGILFDENKMPKPHDPQIWEFAEKARLLIEMSLGIQRVAQDRTITLPDNPAVEPAPEAQGA